MNEIQPLLVAAAVCGTSEEARYALDRWTKFKQYRTVDKTHRQFKTMNRQFGFYMVQKTAIKNNTSSLDGAFTLGNVNTNCVHNGYSFGLY